MTVSGHYQKKRLTLLKSIELKWLAADIGFDKIVMKNGIFLGYFPVILKISFIKY